MKFTKMHGIGNDYVYVNVFDQSISGDLPALARTVSDRHFGIGADGLILIEPSERADARMRMFNADGSEAEMCGNGVRCVAKYIYDHQIAQKPVVTVETGRGVLTLAIEAEGGRAKRVRVDMGEPFLAAELIPTTLPGPRVIDAEWPAGEIDLDPSALSDLGVDPRLTCVSMGNPHVVLYCRDVERIPLDRIGPKLETARCFPKRINVHFVEVLSRGEVRMRTWERGSGITQACGTGACAVCVAGVVTNRTGARLLAHLPGGDLELEWNGKGERVYMTGPATEVFSGVWNPR